MSVWPNPTAVVPVMVGTNSRLCLGTQIAANGWTHQLAVHAEVGAALFIPFLLPSPTLISKLWLYEANTPGALYEMAIYSADGRQIVTSGERTMDAAMNLVKEADVTDTWIDRGQYYFAIASKNAQVDYYAFDNYATGSMKRGLGLFAIGATSTPYPLPATVTPAHSAATEFKAIPHMGFSQRTLVE